MTTDNQSTCVLKQNLKYSALQVASLPENWEINAFCQIWLKNSSGKISKLFKPTEEWKDFILHSFQQDRHHLLAHGNNAIQLRLFPKFSIHSNQERLCNNSVDFESLIHDQRQPCH